MKILKLSIQDKFSGWSLTPVTFGSLTLLVGVSGVGKTRILKSIWDLRGVTTGRALNGSQWDIEFCTSDSARYNWRGEFEHIEGNRFDAPFRILVDDDESSEPADKRPKPKILSEQIFLNGDLVASKEKDSIRFKGKELPKLSNTESLVKLLSAESVISPIVSGFAKMIFRTIGDSVGINFSMLNEPIQQIARRFATEEKLLESDLSTDAKLHIASVNRMPVFRKIEMQFRDIFPQVSGIKYLKAETSEIPYFAQVNPMLHVREKDQDKPVPEFLLSSGMRKTLMHIAELYLWPKGTVFLIDEFENSLGVNCLDVVTEDLLTRNTGVQFIITSHHPYIINNIGMRHWKIVTRKGSVVHARDASEFPLGKSKHEAFLKLTNLSEFITGRATS